MFHFYQAIQNRAGDALAGYYVQAVNAVDAVVTIASDNSGTPIITTSGIANMAKVGTNGMVSFYIADGNYTIKIFAPDGTTLRETYPDVPMTTGTPATPPLPLVDQATITPNTTANNTFYVTLGGNRTLANPTGLQPGMTGWIRVRQDATGSRTLTFGSYWALEGGLATLSAAANAIDLIFFEVVSATEILASIRKGFGAATVTPYTGPVATGTYFPTAYSTTATVTGTNAFTPHWSSEALTSFQLVYVNALAKDLGSGVVETTTGAVALNLTAVIEYPAGTYTRVRKAAANTMPLAIGEMFLTDTITLSIPANTKFIVHTFYSKQGGGDVVVPGVYAMGNAGFNNNTNVDETGTHTILGNVYAAGADWHYGPVAIIGSTAKRSFALIGDSRTIGIQDPVSDTNKGCTGEIARAISAAGYNHLNLGVGFDRADKYIASHALRLQLANYCSEVVIGFGANDLAGGRVTSQIVADSQTIKGYFVTKLGYIYTLPPIATTSTDGYATLVNQTIQFPEFERRIYNEALRSGVAGFVRTWEVADQLDSSRNSGKWRVDLGRVNGYPIADATHENELGNRTIATSGAINLT